MWLNQDDEMRRLSLTRLDASIFHVVNFQKFFFLHILIFCWLYFFILFVGMSGVLCIPWVVISCNFYLIIFSLLRQGLLKKKKKSSQILKKMGIPRLKANSFQHTRMLTHTHIYILIMTIIIIILKCRC